MMLASALGTHAQLADDLLASAARILYPFALFAGLRRMPMDLVAEWMIDDAGLDDDPMHGRVCGND